ncbi:hypothetical protein JIR23_18030 [Bradyrhizobium diazoefficiens]|nr:hypothetical protein [Bradyrhizobium diazoefficiens]QQN61547.1 hypothetical protein JIR23_18030 [Bradyrhizobium diazoefficiens]
MQRLIGEQHKRLFVIAGTEYFPEESVVPVQNDTEVFYAVRVDPRTREQDRTDPRMGTREAIHKRGLQADPVSRSFCPHQWLDADGFVNQELARLHPYSHQLPDGPTGFATAMGATPP